MTAEKTNKEILKGIINDLLNKQQKKILNSIPTYDKLMVDTIGNMLLTEKRINDEEYARINEWTEKQLERISDNIYIAITDALQMFRD